MQRLGCDFYVFSGHKMLAPTGVGVLWGRMENLEHMDPFMGGGEMIKDVSFDSTTYNELPYKQKDYFTFGSFNNFMKVNDEVLDTWIKILKHVKIQKLGLRLLYEKIKCMNL